MGEGRCMCVVGEKKKERQGGTWVVGKKKEIKKKKEMESGVYVYVEKKGYDEIRCGAVLAVMSVVSVKLTPLLLRAVHFRGHPLIF